MRDIFLILSACNIGVYIRKVATFRTAQASSYLGGGPIEDRDGGTVIHVIEHDSTQYTHCAHTHKQDFYIGITLHAAIVRRAVLARLKGSNEDRHDR